MASNGAAADSNEAPIGEAATAQPISFRRWASPVLAAWFIVSLGFVATHDFGQPVFFSLPMLFPLYAALYLARTNILLRRGSISEKGATCALLLLICVPASYLISPMIWGLAGFLGFLIAAIPLMVLSALDLPQAVVIVPTFPIVVGITFGLTLMVSERLTIVSTFGAAHILGLMATGVLAFAVIICVPALWAMTLLSLAVLAVLPIPHLFVVWRRLIRYGEPGRSHFSIRRAAVVAAVVYGLVYGVGVMRFAPDYGMGGLLWPQTALARPLSSSSEASFTIPGWQYVDRLMSAALGWEWVSSRRYHVYMPSRCYRRLGSQQEGR